MRCTIAILGAAIGLVGCKAVDDPVQPVWRAAGIERWRLTERAYGELDEPWSLGGDGAIAAAAPALFFEAVLRVAPSSSAPSSGRGQGPCRHEVRLRYEGGKTHPIGAFAETTLEIGGPPGLAHVVEIRGSHDGVRLTGVKGAHPLVGEPGRFVLAAGERASIRFTSEVVGRGGLEVRLVGEVGDAEGATADSPPAAVR